LQASVLAIEEFYERIGFVKVLATVAEEF